MPAAAEQEVDWEAVEALDKAINENGHIVKDFAGVSDDEMEALYAVALQEFDAGKFEDAELRFALLCRLDHYSGRFWLGLGATRQMMKRYKDAINAYALAGLHDGENPVPGLRAAECYLAVGDLDNALSGAKAAVHWSEGKPELAAFAARAEALMESIKRQQKGAKS
jgi:type III secretion system low calcium response chaperone LcrH/SycD